MADSNAFAETSSRPMQASRARTIEREAPLPRTLGLTIAVGVSLVMWAVLIEIGVRAWSLAHL